MQRHPVEQDEPMILIRVAPRSSLSRTKRASHLRRLSSIIDDADTGAGVNTFREDTSSIGYKLRPGTISLTALAVCGDGVLRSEWTVSRTNLLAT